MSYLEMDFHKLCPLGMNLVLRLICISDILFISCHIYLVLLKVAYFDVNSIMYFIMLATVYINVRKHRRGIKNNEKSRETGNTGYIIRRKPKEKQNIIYVLHHYAIANTKFVHVFLMYCLHVFAWKWIFTSYAPWGCT